MKRVAVLTPTFVDCIPETLRDGDLYVTIAYATAVHRCCCGCGIEVVTPLSPKDWRLIFDGISVSLEPSIGNWAFACRSHYWVRRNRVVWAEAWSPQRVALAREVDREARARGSGDEGTELRDAPPPDVVVQSDSPVLPHADPLAATLPWWRRFVDWLLHRPVRK